MKKPLLSFGILLIGVAVQAALVRLVPEDGVSKAFTLKTDSEVESVVVTPAKGIWKNVEFSAE